MLAPARSIAATLAPVSGTIPFAYFTTLVLELARAAQTTAVAVTLRLLNDTGLSLGCRCDRGGRCWQPRDTSAGDKEHSENSFAHSSSNRASSSRPGTSS